MACIYDALVIRNVDGQQVSTMESVDLLALHAIDFDKIIINGDVNLGSGKGEALPDFTNVEINGEFDCSSFAISADSVLPSGITSLKCLYSFNDLSVLKGILPGCVKVVYVRNAIINSLKKNDIGLAAAKEIITKYPNLDIVGKNEALRLNDVINQPASVTVKPIKKIGGKTKENKTKEAQSAVTKGYLTTSEACEALKVLDAYKDISLKELKKLLKNFLYNNIPKVPKKR